MSHLALVLRALEFLLLIVTAFFREQTKEEGRQEVRDQQETAIEAATEVAAEIDASVRDADLDDLRERMRASQRPADHL